jgi:hypothetical protein
MSLAADDDFLGIIAQQAQLAYAMQQLHACQQALQNWQAKAALGVGASDNLRARHELVYYTQQIERWQDYLRLLGMVSNPVSSVRALMALDGPRV